MAEATIAYHAGIDKRDQFIEWNDPHSVNAGARNFFDRVDWRGDGQSFVVHPKYAGTYPEQRESRGARWGKVGQAVGHASTPIHIKQVSGPIVITGENTFRIQYDELAPATEKARVTFMAFSEGDDEYRYTERVGMINSKRVVRTSGKSQTIIFPPIGSIKAGSNPVPLKATSDAGLLVEYHIAYGPAQIRDGRLVIAEIPKRARFPIRVKVIAYQFGRGATPLFQPAIPVEQTTQIEAP